MSLSRLKNAPKTINENFRFSAVMTSVPTYAPLDKAKISLLGKILTTIDPPLTQQSFSPMIIASDFNDMPPLASISTKIPKGRRIVLGADGGTTFITKVDLIIKTVH